MAKVETEEGASFLNKATFWWVIGILRSFGRDDYELSEKNLPKLLKKDESRKLLSQISLWNHGQSKSTRSLFKCLMLTLGKDAAVAFPAILINIISLLVQPTLVSEVVSHLQNPSHHTATRACLLAAAIVVLRVVTCVSTVHGFHPMFRLAMRARAALACMIYKKTLELKACKLNKHGGGHIINLLSTDLEVVVVAFQQCRFLLIGPPVTIVCTGLIINEVGIICALPGIIVIFVIIIIGVVFSKIQAKVRQAIASRTDKRIQVITEVISAIHVVKMNAWEKYFLQEIGKVRKNELIKVFQRGILFTCNMAGTNCYHVMISLAVLLTFTYSGGSLSPVLAIRVYGWSSIIAYFISISTVYMLRMVEAYRSIQRIEHFLASDAADSSRPCEQFCKEDVDISLKNAQYSWNDFECSKPEDPDLTSNFELIHVDLNTRKGQLIMVLGAVGSGKTTLLMAILGELQLISGSTEIIANRSFSGQDPWIFSDSVKANILFGSSYDATKYDRVLDACCLRQDIASFSEGDKTQVGQRGLKLSGGQKARISLARAAYKDANLYMFDDPLSAVDSKVGHQIFHKCINGMNTTKTRIIATHNTDFVKMADHVIIFEKGQIVASGAYELIKHSLLPVSPTTSERTQDNSITEISQHCENASEKDGGMVQTESDALLSDRHASSIRQYWTYAKSGNLAFYIFFLLLLCVNQAILYSTNWWLIVWSYTEIEFGISEGNQSTIAYSKSYFTGIYAVLSVSVVITAYLSITSTALHAYLASKSLHSGLFRRMLRAPMSFFDITPVGNIVNNFSRDMGIADLVISEQFMLSHLVGLKVLASIVFAAVVSPWSALSIPPFILMVAFIRWFAARGSRQYKNLESACKSPIYSHVSNTLKGHTVIRAFNRQHHFMNQFHDLLDKHTSAWNTFICISRWMSLWVGIVFALYIATLLAVAFLTSHDGAQSGLVGFALIHAILCVDVLTFFTEVATDLGNHLTAIGRIQRSSEIEQEGPFETDETIPNKWPACGDIVIDKVSLRYPTSPTPAIKTMSAAIRDNEKIGLVGRTGSGKSSVIRAMLRLTEAEGSIIINGIDIKDIGLCALRSNITTIPQDPVLFDGTVRRNMDPLSEHGDDRLWDVLRQTQLDGYVRSLPAGLDSYVGVSGSIFSAGQKQLMCLARALLRNNKILLIDEATANVDHQTDEIIQQTIRERLFNCTVLTIAHRIQTVMDSDRIMVMDAGNLLEFDTPQKLLDNMDSYFYHLTHMSKD